MCSRQGNVFLITPVPDRSIKYWLSTLSRPTTDNVSPRAKAGCSSWVSWILKLVPFYIDSRRGRTSRVYGFLEVLRTSQKPYASLCKRINFIIFHAFFSVYGSGQGPLTRGPWVHPVYLQKHMEHDEIDALTEGVYGFWEVLKTSKKPHTCDVLPSALYSLLSNNHGPTNVLTSRRARFSKLSIPIIV